MTAVLCAAAAGMWVGVHLSAGWRTVTVAALLAWAGIRSVLAAAADLDDAISEADYERCYRCHFPDSPHALGCPCLCHYPLGFTVAEADEPFDGYGPRTKWWGA